MADVLIPKVSIILPVYNGAKYIRQSIDSCLDQTFADLELIVVDDCSTDETPQIVRSYKDPRIRYIRNETNQRLPRSLNVGFAQAKGDYVTWTSDDNVFMPEAIARMVKVLDEKHYEFVYADIYALHEDLREAAQYEKLPEPDKLKEINSVRACFLYTRNVMRTVGEYDPDMELIEDYDFWVRVAQKFKIFRIAEPLYYYRYHGRQLYIARNREVKIIELLFKVKHDFLSLEEVNWYMRDFIIKKSKGPNILKIFQTKLYYKPRIEKLFKTYKDGQLTFTEARIAFQELTKNVQWDLAKKHFVLLRKLPPTDIGEWGGLECLMMDWLKRIDYQSWRVSVIVTSGWKEKFQSEMKGLPVDVVEFPFSLETKPFERFKNMFQFLKKLEADRAVFFQGWLWEFRLPEVLASYLVTRNHTFMHENLGPPPPPPKTSKKHFGFIPGLALWWHKPRLFTNLRAYFCKYIIVVSHEIKDNLISMWGYPGKKIAVCYHGVNMDEFRPSQDMRSTIRKELNISPAETVFIMAARLTQQKRVDRMIEAFDILCRKHSQVKLLIAGDGPLESELKELAGRKACFDRIVFLGHISNVSDYLKASDISVLSSDNEGFGIALVEALAVGVICISTHCPGPSEIIEDGVNGFLVDKSVDGVLDGLNRALNLSDDKRRALSKNAREHACHNFEINKNVFKAFSTLRVAYLGSP